MRNFASAEVGAQSIGAGSSQKHAVTEGLPAHFAARARLLPFARHWHVPRKQA